MGRRLRVEKPEQQSEEGAGGSRFGDFALTRLDETQLAERGFERLSAAQRLALPGLVRGENVLMLAPSGTGRTALAAMMAVDRVDREQTGLQAVLLVLTPDTVVETAAEVARVGGWTESAVLAVQPGLRRDRIGAALRKGAVVAVGTPARVLDLVQRGALSLQTVAFVAVLEADLMLQLEAEATLERLAALVPPSAQRMISAAQPTERLQLLARSLCISEQGAAVSTTPLEWAQLRDSILEVAEDEKLDLLSALRAHDRAEGRETVVLVRSMVWRRWVQEGLAWRGVQGCRVEEERSYVAVPAEESGGDGGGRGSQQRLLVSYHLPLEPGSWLPAGEGSGTILVTPAEYWDLVRLSRETCVPPVQEPALTTQVTAPVPTPNTAALTHMQPEEPGEAPAAPVVAEAEAVEVAVPDVVPLQPDVPASPGPQMPEQPTLSEAASSETHPPESEEAEAEVAAEGEAAEEPEKTGPAKGRRRREGARDDGLTEAERVARRHIRRDVARKIERIDPEDAARESERLARESVRESIYQQVFADETQPEAAAMGPEVEREEAARRRRLEVAARLDEARRQLAVNGLRAATAQGAVAGEEPAVMEREPLTPDEERLVAFAQGVLEAVSGWLRAESEVSAVHRALAERLLQDRDAGDVIAVLLQRLFVATPALPAPLATAEEGESGVARLFISLGRQAGVNQQQLLRLVEQMSGVPEAELGRADVLARYSFLEVKAEAAERVIAEMNGKRYRGREIAVDRAKPPRNTWSAP